jgi:hypothetical protein
MGSALKGVRNLTCTAATAKIYCFEQGCGSDWDCRRLRADEGGAPVKLLLVHEEVAQQADIHANISDLQILKLTSYPSNHWKQFRPF